MGASGNSVSVITAQHVDTTGLLSKRVTTAALQGGRIAEGNAPGRGGDAHTPQCRIMRRPYTRGLGHHLSISFYMICTEWSCSLFRARHLSPLPRGRGWGRAAPISLAASRAAPLHAAPLSPPCGPLYAARLSLPLAAHSTLHASLSPLRPTLRCTPLSPPCGPLYAARLSLPLAAHSTLHASLSPLRPTLRCTLSLPLAAHSTLHASLSPLRPTLRCTPLSPRTCGHSGGLTRPPPLHCHSRGRGFVRPTVAPVPIPASSALVDAGPAHRPPAADVDHSLLVGVQGGLGPRRSKMLHLLGATRHQRAPFR